MAALYTYRHAPPTVTRWTAPTGIGGDGGDPGQSWVPLTGLATTRDDKRFSVVSSNANSMREQIDFTDSVVVVTGGASDVGRAISESFAEEGADVVVADIDDERGREAVTSVSEATEDARATYVHTDVSSYEACESLVEDVLDEFGRIDVLVNAAAVAAPSVISKPFLEEGPDDWEPQLRVTFMGTVNPTHAALPALVEQEGAVVNLCSEAYKGQDTQYAMYGAAKSAVATFTRTLAKEVGEDGVRINAISPSATRTEATEAFLDRFGDAVTDQHALPRLGRPTDHANLAVFLASDAADWITGQVVSVNGGYL